MNLPLLKKWLELKSEHWPPNHYALLGLNEGEGAADEIELRVLDRMERLRSYQLVHPDLVTEGMNRLAQALNCLTDLEAKKNYDQTLGLRQPVVKPPVPKKAAPFRFRAASVGFDAKGDATVALKFVN